MNGNRMQQAWVLSLYLLGQSPGSALEPPLPAAKGLPDCRSVPPFTRSLGFDPRHSAFSTSDRLHYGLVYTEVLPPNRSQAVPAKPKIYQHPSWTTAGSLGPMVIDRGGNIYVAPLPMVNLFRNDPAKQNMLYHVNPETGEMKPYLTLPTVHPPHERNPFGILGLGYDCATGVIYASSVQGSDRQHEVGRIYAIKTGSTPGILDQIENIDGFGMGIGVIEGKKKLFFGRARTPEILAVEIGSDGRFVGKPEFALSLDGLGIRGDDHARKIRFAENGDLTVHGVEFYFNLTAPTEVQQTAYTFRYGAEQKKWELALPSLQR